MVVRSSYLHNGISYTGKMTSLYWIGAQADVTDKISVLYIFFPEFLVAVPNNVKTLKMEMLFIS